MLTRRRLLRVLPFSAAALSGCEKPKAPSRYQLPDTPLNIVTTTVQAADLLRRIGGDSVNVRSLMAPGVNPHLWKPTAAELADAQIADAFFLNGLRLERAFTADLDSLRTRGLTVGVLANGLSDNDILTRPDGSPDPHFWMNPRLWIKAAKEAAEVLAEAFPAGANWFRDRCHEHSLELEDLYLAAFHRMESVAARNRFLLSSHDSMAYFAAAFGLEVRSLANSAGEAPAKAPEALVKWLEEHRIRSLFREHSAAPEAIKALAKPLSLNSDPVIFSLSLAPPGTKLVGLSSEMEVDQFPQAFRFSVDTIHGVLMID